MPPIIVRILKPKNGEIRAQVLVGAKAARSTALTNFNEEIRKVFGESPEPFDEVSCAHTEVPTDKSVRPAPGARVQNARTYERSKSPRQCRPPTAPGARVQNARTYETCQLQGFEREELLFAPEQTNNHGRRLTVDALKVTDRFLAARKGASFKTDRDKTLESYARDIVEMGLATQPDIDRNPYNFVPWIGREPTKAQEPEEATHDRISDGRLSGRITVTFTARTPIFVPEGQLRKSGSNDGNNISKTLDFFHCWNGSCERYAIPGASVKGAVRSVFEALTNSRAGVTDDTVLERPRLYRRRASRLFQIVRMPSETTPGEVQECAYALCAGNGTPCETKQHERERIQRTGYHDQHPHICAREWRANLFWVSPEHHQHGLKKKIRFHPRNNTQPLPLSQESVDRFKSMKGHHHFENHLDNAASASRPAYGTSPPSYSEIENDLFTLKPGDIVFGIPGNGELHCFGKNVNFLWPGTRSPREMMNGFAERKPEDQKLEDSDPAEATFGFAGKHAGSSHPFRGRVRFGTFWGPRVAENKPDSLRLMPLTSPSGTKAKARPLYLEPASDGISADYNDDARLRGRKFYWHQRGKDANRIPGVHDLDALKSGVPGAWETEIATQLPDPIRPLPTKTQFKGALHFTNLTKAELGALLVAVEPDLAFGEEASAEPARNGSPAYGIKLGKGKPRGLGSVSACVSLELSATRHERYRCLTASIMAKAHDMHDYVEAYKKWLAPNGGWDSLDMVKALKALLKMPSNTSVRVYPPQFALYGWLPDLDKPDGRPRGSRPKAMTPAYKQKGP